MNITDPEILAAISALALGDPVSPQMKQAVLAATRLVARPTIVFRSSQPGLFDIGPPDDVRVVRCELEALAAAHLAFVSAGQRTVRAADFCTVKDPRHVDNSWRNEPDVVKRNERRRELEAAWLGRPENSLRNGLGRAADRLESICFPLASAVRRLKVEGGFVVAPADDPHIDIITGPD